MIIKNKIILGLEPKDYKKYDEAVLNLIEIAKRRYELIEEELPHTQYEDINIATCEITKCLNEIAVTCFNNGRDFEKNGFSDESHEVSYLSDNKTGF